MHLNPSIGSHQSDLQVYGLPWVVHPRLSQPFRRWEGRIKDLNGPILEASEIRGRIVPSAQAIKHCCSGVASYNHGVLFISRILQICKGIIWYFVLIKSTYYNIFQQMGVIWVVEGEWEP